MGLSNTGKAMRRIGAALKLVDNAEVHKLLTTAHQKLKQQSVKEARARPRRITRPRTKTKEIESLWGRVIKKRANYKSEISLRDDSFLHPHHIEGKKNLWLRFSLDNGICLTAGEHNNGAHGDVPTQQRYRKIFWLVRGQVAENRVMALRNKSGRPDLGLLKYQFEQMLKD